SRCPRIPRNHSQTLGQTLLVELGTGWPRAGPGASARGRRGAAGARLRTGGGGSVLLRARLRHGGAGGSELMTDLSARVASLIGALTGRRDVERPEASAPSNDAGQAQPTYSRADGEPVRLLTVEHPDGRMSRYPPPEHWNDWVEWDSKAWPRKLPRRYTLVPTICFNCESACGLLAYVDKTSFETRKFEGNPAHPGSRGRNCAKGPATH